MKKLLFGHKYVWNIIGGEKKISIRRAMEGKHNFFKGEAVLAMFQGGMAVMLRMTANTERKIFCELTDMEAREDGYENVEDAFIQLRTEHYATLTKEDQIAILRFQVYDVDGVPVVSTGNSL